MEKKEISMKGINEVISFPDIGSAIENVKGPEAWEKIEKAVENGAKVAIIAFCLFTAIELINSFMKK
jgi:hypothetical protein